MPEPVEIAPKVVCEPKVWTDAPIIEEALKDKGVVDSGCSRHITGNQAHLADYKEFKGGCVAFRGSNRRITGKEKIKACRFSWVYFLKSKDETTPFLKDFIRQVENQFNYKVNTIRSDNRIELKNNDLIEFCGLKDSFLPTTFWAEAVNTACYVLDRVLVTKPQNKRPYEILTGRQPVISYLRPFKFHVTILNTIDQLSKFDGKYDSGFLVGYSLNSKAFRVYNLETKRVAKNLHVNFLKNKHNVAGKGYSWMFDLDYLTNFMNYEPVSLENQANKSVGPKEANNSVGTQANDDQDKIEKNTDFKTCEKPVSQLEQIFLEGLEKLKRQEKEANDGAESLRKEATHDTQNANTNSTNLLNIVSAPVSTVGPSRAFNDDELSYPDDPSMPHVEDIYANPSEGIFTDSSYDDEGVVTDLNNLETTFQIQKVWILVDLPFGKKAIGTKWVYLKKKDEIGVVVRNKARLVTQGHRKDEGIDYDESAFLYGKIDEEVYVTQPLGFVDPKFPNKVCKVIKALYGLHQAPRAWYATLSTFLEKSRYRRGVIDKTLFIKQEKKDIMLVLVYVDDIILGSTRKSWCDEFEELMKNSVKITSTPIKTQKPLVKDEEAADVDVHLYRFQVTPKTLHLQAMKRIFRYLKGQPKLGFWYPKVSSFDLEAYSNSDYAGANLDRKSTTREDVIRQDLLLDDANGVECLPNEEIFSELTRISMVRNVDTHSKFLMYPWFLQVIINAQVDDLTSHHTHYTSLALTEKVFANMRRIGNGFLGVETPLFATMLVQPQATTEEEKDEEDEVPTALKSPSPTPAPSPPPQDLIPLQAQSVTPIPSP
nr:hypothetical protein [Tanacetum cinerariifolium]